MSRSHHVTKLYTHTHTQRHFSRHRNTVTQINYVGREGERGGSLESRDKCNTEVPRLPPPPIKNYVDRQKKNKELNALSLQRVTY